MANIGSAYVEILPSAKGMSGLLQKEMGGTEKTVNDSTRKGFLGGIAGLAGPLAAAVGALGLGTAISDSIRNASDLRETQSAVSVVFGESSKAVQSFAKDAAAGLGMTQQKALEGARTFGVFGQAAGLSGGDLANFSTDLVGLATDFASFNNVEPEVAIEAIGAALRGESEPIRQFGVMLDDATLKARAMEMGIYDGTGALTQQQRVLAAQAEVFSQAGVQQGDFGRTSDGLANQQRKLSASLGDLSAAFGGLFLPVVTEVVQALNGGAIPAVTAFFDSLSSGGAGGAVSVFADMLGPLAPLGSAFLGLWQALSPVSILFQALTPLWGQLVPVIGQFAGAAQTLVSGVLTALAPLLELVVSAISQLLAAVLPLIPALLGLLTPLIQLVSAILPPIIGLFVAILEPVIQLAAAIIGALVPVLAFLIGVLTEVINFVVGVFTGQWSDTWQSIGDFFVTLWDGIVVFWQGVWNSIVSFVTTYINTVRAIIVAVASAIVARWNAFWSSIGSFISGVWRGIVASVSGAINNVRNIINGVMNTIKSIWSNTWNTVKGFVTGAFNGIKNAVKGGIDGVVNFVKSLPGRAASALGNLGGLLVGKGRALIQGFVNGIRAMIGAVGDAVGGVLNFARGFFPSSPAKRGPFSGAGWRQVGQAGAAIEKQFEAGFTGRMGDILTSGVTVGAARFTGTVTAPTGSDRAGMVATMTDPAMDRLAAKIAAALLEVRRLDGRDALAAVQQGAF